MSEQCCLALRLSVKSEFYTGQIIYPLHRIIKMLGLPGIVSIGDLLSLQGLLEQLRRGFIEL